MGIIWTRMSTVIYTVYVVEYVMHLGLDEQPWDTPVQVRKPTPPLRRPKSRCHSESRFELG